MDLLLLGSLLLFNSAYRLLKLLEKEKAAKEKNETIGDWHKVQSFLMLMLFVMGLVSTSPALFARVLHGGHGIIFTSIFPRKIIEDDMPYFIFSETILLAVHCCIVGYALEKFYKNNSKDFYDYLCIFDIFAVITLIWNVVYAWT